MFLRKFPRTKGDYLAIVESVYDGVAKKVKQKVVMNIGYLEDLKKEYDDPIAHFKQIAADMNEEKKKASAPETLTIQMDESLSDGEDNLYNVGYGILRRLYQELDLDLFWRTKASKDGSQYDINKIFRLLVLGRAMFPASKKSTYENRGRFFEDMGDYSIDDVYHSLDLIAKNKEKLQKWIFEKSGKLFDRDMSILYFDCTNYYFDIGRSDRDIIGEDGTPIDKDGNPTAAKYAKRGPEKNHRPDPIVEMGLLTDRNGIPVAFDLFPGNESEKVHMRPLIKRVKREYESSRVIVVADRGLNTSDNIYFLNGDNTHERNPFDGYVYGMSVRGADQEFRDWVLSGGYSTDIAVDDEQTSFVHKSRIAKRLLHVNYTDRNGKKKKKDVYVDQKQMVYYSQKYADKQKADRDVMVERAKDLIKHPQNYNRVTSAGSAGYVNNISFSKTTGEIVSGKSLTLNEEKIAEEAKYDGYYSIVTSELNMTDMQMRLIYRGLIQIEDVFRISKTEFEARPIYVKTNDHIDAHFMTCFVALVLIRLLHRMMDMEIPVSHLLDSMRKYNCISLDGNKYQFLYYDKVLKAVGEKFDMQLDKKYRTRDEVRRLLKY